MLLLRLIIFLQNSKVNTLTVTYKISLVRVWKTQQKHEQTKTPNLRPPTEIRRYLPVDEWLSNSGGKFAYNSTALFYMCCKYNVLLTWEMWTIIVSKTITLQRWNVLSKRKFPSRHNEHALEYLKFAKTRLHNEIRKFSETFLAYIPRHSFIHLNRDERKFAESNQAISNATCMRFR